MTELTDDSGAFGYGESILVGERVRLRGDAGTLWSDGPTAIELRQRLEVFPGIGQKKAAMAVEILARDLGKPLKDMSGSDIATTFTCGGLSFAPEW